MKNQASEFIEDNEKHDIPEEILLPLTHKDVKLGFFKDRQIEIRAMRCGEELIWKEQRLWPKAASGKPVVQLSAACKGRIERLENKGYRITSARIRSMVYWEPDDDYPGEFMVILPELVLTCQEL